MKLCDLVFSMCALTLGACSTNPYQNVSNNAHDELVEEAIDLASANVVEAYEDDDADLERVICKRIVVTGSRFGTKLCMTWREWQDRAEDAKNFTNTTQTRTRI